MRNRSIRRLTAVAALALAALAVAACNPVEAQSVPSQTPSPATPSTQTPSVQAPKPSQTHVPSTPRPRACFGAVVHTVDANEGGPPWPAVCITVGGVVRLEHLGPEYLSVNPSNKVSCFYAAGVHVCRLVQTGTVRFTIRNSKGTRPLTVVVAEATSPPKPSPACMDAATFTIDANDGGPPWSAMCLKVGAVLRVENLGPDGFSVKPSGTVSCWYEAGVRECRFVKAGTVTFTITRPEVEIRSLTVVAIK